MVNIYKYAFTFWHHPRIEPGTFQSQVVQSNHYSTTTPSSVAILHPWLSSGQVALSLVYVWFSFVLYTTYYTTKIYIKVTKCKIKLKFDTNNQRNLQKLS